MKHLLTPAAEILDLNWKDGFTIPAHKLYPFQWNWDSGFVSIGHSYFNLSRAMQELDSLFSGQWENGMVPHIIFHSETETTYFPNFDFWKTYVNQGAPQQPKSSGITQPPVHGFVLENLMEKYPDNAELNAFARRIFPKIVHFHRFLYTYRDPLKEGLFLMYHPWESGRDNSPLWDESLKRIEIQPDQIPAYTRRDLNAADASHRPTDAQYDRYVYLIELGKSFQYDGQAILEESPFLIQDAMMNAILIKSNQSLINMGKNLGLDTGEVEEWQQQSMASFSDKFWHQGLQTFVSYDFVSKEQIAHWEIGGLVPIFAEIATEEQVAACAAYLTSLHERGYYLCPSFDVDSPLFDSKRYWRGPVWPQMNWMLHKGLKAYGQHKLAELMKTDLLELVSKLGFFEYFESQKNLVKEIDQGYGGALFSWTASSVIDLIHTS